VEVCNRSGRRVFFKWYDFWVGIYWDKEKQRVYIIPFPMVGYVIHMRGKESKELEENMKFQLMKCIEAMRICDVMMKVRNNKRPEYKIPNEAIHVVDLHETDLGPFEQK
jgi:hypothetical protein